VRDGGQGEGARKQRDGRETEPGATIGLEKAAAPAKGAPHADERGAGAGVVVKHVLPPAALAGVTSGVAPICGAGVVSSCSADSVGSSGAGVTGNAGTSARHGAAVGDVCGGAGDARGGLPRKSHLTSGVRDGGAAVGGGVAQDTEPGSGGGDNGGEGFVSTWGCSNGSGGAVLQDGGGVWEGPFPWSDRMQEVLRRTFNLTRFRPLQSPVINCFLSRNDAFVLLPTGGGKSLCYQARACAHAPSPCPFPLALPSLFSPFSLFTILRAGRRARNCRV
jgi:hypothetical protein